MRTLKIGLLGLVLAAVLVWLPGRASAGDVRIGIGGGVTISTRYGDFRVGYRHRPQRRGGDWCGTPQVNRRIYERRYGRHYQGSGYPAYGVLNGGLSGSGYPVRGILSGGLSLRSSGYRPRPSGHGWYDQPPRYYQDYRYGHPYRHAPVGGQPPVVVVVPKDRRDDDTARLIERARRWKLERGQDEQEYLAMLLSQLKSRNEEERLEAVQALAKLPPESRIRKALEKVLKKDPKAKIRREAAKALGELREEAAVSALEKAQKKDPDKGVREEAGRSIKKIRFTTPLVQLQSDDEDDREKAVKKLAKLPYPKRVIGILGEVLLSDPEPDVREEAAEQLGKLKNPRALPVLKRAGSDPDEDVRKAVAKAQKKIIQSARPRPAVRPRPLPTP